MKYAILAAGKGSRLKQEGISVPKPLVKVAGEYLIDRLIRIFTNNEAEEILVICNDTSPDVITHITKLEKEGLYGHQLNLRHIVKTTLSSMHSFFELSKLKNDDSPFILTTVDTIFREDEFATYIQNFKQLLTTGKADGLMGVTDYIDDEKPLYISTSQTDAEELLIENFLDVDPKFDCKYISGGIYGLSSPTISTLKRCISEGQSHMRNFQRGLLIDGFRIFAHPFSKVLDIDHAGDIEKANKFLTRSVTCITRSERFSPNSVENDRRILELVAKKLVDRGYKVNWLKEEQIDEESEDDFMQTDVILCMARSKEVLSWLDKILLYRKECGLPACQVINSINGIRLCNNRASLLKLQQSKGIPIPNETGKDGIWLKRGIGTSEVPEDVVFCKTQEEVENAKRMFQKRGINEICQQAHIVGDIVKFYGVGTTSFFYMFYPTDCARSKFGLEVYNGVAHHYPLLIDSLKSAADNLSITTGVLVYGGDAIVREDGSFVIIDFNDWPTFSPCREEASYFIASLVK